MTRSGFNSELREYDRLADRIRLHRQADGRALAVVEGPSDKRLVQKLFRTDQVYVFVGGTRREVLEVADELGSLSMRRLACLVDLDFDDAVAVAVEAQLPVVAYDGADLEDMLMWSPAAERVLGELARILR